MPQNPSFNYSHSQASSNVLGGSNNLSRLLAPPGELDEIDLDQLTKIVLDAEFDGSPESDTNEFAYAVENLDQLYTVKVFRYLSTPTDRSALAQLADHLSRVAADLFFTRLESLDKRYGSRWKMLLDLVQVALRVDRIEHKESDSAKHFGEAPESWGWIVSRVAQFGSTGLEWSILMEAIQNGEAAGVVNTRTKSGLSMLLTSMRHAGWLRVVAQGRTRRLYLGNRAISPLESSTESNQSPPVNRSRDDSRILNEVIKSGTCYNGGAFLDFLLLASERHKALKDSLRRGITVPLPEKTKQKLVSLCVHLHGQTQRAAENNFCFIERYFELSGRQTSVLPRISVKLVDRVNGEELVLDLARNHPRSTSPNRAAIHSNTGFDEIRKSGKYHLINDIAKEVFSQRYKNPRLRTERVSEFLSSAVLRSTGNITPTQWRGLWIGAEKEENFRSAYRSTLIVPITLVNSAVSSDFREFVREHTNPKDSTHAIDRTIMGFLCFDHVDANYFNESSDVDIGYMFADWLSLFLFVRYMYTSMSTTFSRCSAEFDSSHFVDGLRKKIALDRNCFVTPGQLFSVGAPMSSRYNDVFPTDALQRAYVGV